MINMDSIEELSEERVEYIRKSAEKIWEKYKTPEELQNSVLDLCDKAGYSIEPLLDVSKL